MIATYEINSFMKKNKHRIIITDGNSEYVLSLIQAKNFKAELESSIRACKIATEREE